MNFEFTCEGELLGSVRCSTLERVQRFRTGVEGWMGPPTGDPPKGGV